MILLEKQWQYAFYISEIVMYSWCNRVSYRFFSNYSYCYLFSLPALFEISNSYYEYSMVDFCSRSSGLILFGLPVFFYVVYLSSRLTGWFDGINYYNYFENNILQKQPPKLFCKRRCSWQALRPVTLLKRDSNTGVYL